MWWANIILFILVTSQGSDRNFSTVQIIRAASMLEAQRDVAPRQHQVNALCLSDKSHSIGLHVL